MTVSPLVVSFSSCICAALVSLNVQSRSKGQFSVTAAIGISLTSAENDVSAYPSTYKISSEHR